MQTKALRAGAVHAFIFTADEPGDLLPMHRHGPADNHISIIARGEFRVHGPAIGDHVYGAGAILDWGEGVDHEIVAIGAGARIVNILKGG